MTMIKGILIDAKERKVEIVSINDELNEYYKLLDCEYIEIPVRNIGGKPYAIVCDEEGLLLKKYMSAVHENSMEILVGNLFICNNGNDGYLHSLNKGDIELILGHTTNYSTRGDVIRPLLVLD